MTKLQTIKGRTFDLLNPTAEMIDPDEICVVLSRIPRFGGHTIEPYFVAQHSLLVESLVDDPALKLPALLHDAHEVYSGFSDVQSPAKYLNESVMKFLRSHADMIDVAVGSRFGFRSQCFHTLPVTHSDMVALATERRDLLAVSDPAIWYSLPEPAAERIVTMSSRQAENAFRKRLYELWEGR